MWVAKFGAYANLGAYYMVAIPIAVILAFVLHVGGKGLWLGITCGLFVQTVLLFPITLCIEWEQQVSSSNDSIHS
ncbi:hypothetical protein SUGI_0142870 [Cryptomeria japonica]|nr:hypothetical protein SUGI_0142870 [Cryptomeria japonica]